MENAQGFFFFFCPGFLGKLFFNFQVVFVHMKGVRH